MVVDNKHEDKAWVEFKTPISKDQLLEFCSEIERLLRINPYLTDIEWENISQEQNRFSALNHSQEPAFEIQTNVQIEKDSDSVIAHYSDGLKLSTTFSVEEDVLGSKLTITEHYRYLSDQEYEKHFHEIDKSLSKWAEEIQTYIMQWHKWSWFAPWRWYKEYVWLQMKPAARRISYILILVSIAETALIILIAVFLYLKFL